MKALFRGFCRNENGKETIWLNGEEVKGDWVYWDEWGILKNPNALGDGCEPYTLQTKTLLGIYTDECLEITEPRLRGAIIPETVSEAVRGLKDKNGRQVFEWDIVHSKSEFVDEVYLISYRDCGFKLIYQPSNGVVSLTNNKSKQLEVIVTKWDKGE